MNKKSITLAHSPDADDIFMFAAIAYGWVDSKFSYQASAADIQTLNEACKVGKFDVCAISFGLYPKIASEYALLRCASSFGDGYGPKLIKRKDKQLKPNFKVALSGADTTNALIFQREFNKARVVYKNFLEIESAVLSGEVDAGVLIHESILNIHPDLQVEANLYDIWCKHSKRLCGEVLRLPLGGMAIRRSLLLSDACMIEAELAKAVEVGVKTKKMLSKELLIRDQVRVNAKDLDTYLSMYANESSVLLDEEQIKALDVLFMIASELGMPLVKTQDNLLPQEYLKLRYES